ncbi:hypothetical protein ACU8KH_02707 [Lachancea thermotolerans]
MQKHGCCAYEFSKAAANTWTLTLRATSVYEPRVLSAHLDKASDIYFSKNWSDSLQWLMNFGT